MSKPSGSIKQVHLPTDATGVNHDIIPDAVGNGSYKASCPTLSADATLALTSDLPTLSNTGGTELLTVGGTSVSIVTRDTAQTISSIKTFSSDPVLNNTKYLKGKNTGGSKYNLIGLSSNNTVDVGNTSETLILQSSGYVRPHNNGGVSLGTSGYKWKDIYISGQLADGNNANYGLVLPNTSGWTANKTIATTDAVGGMTLRRWS